MNLAIPPTLQVQAILVGTDPPAAYALSGANRALRYESDAEREEEQGAESGVASPRSPGGGGSMKPTVDASR